MKQAVSSLVCWERGSTLELATIYLFSLYFLELVNIIKQPAGVYSLDLINVVSERHSILMAQKKMEARMDVLDQELESMKEQL